MMMTSFAVMPIAQRERSQEKHKLGLKDIRFFVTNL